MPTFRIEQQATIGARVPLPKKEARHLSSVLRIVAGDCVRVMDPAGGRYEGSVVQEGKGLSVLIDKKLPPLPDPYPVHLFLSLLKRDKIEWVIQKSVELNMAAVHLITTERSIRQELSAMHMKRLERIAEEAQKQCGRPRPLVIAPPILMGTLSGTAETKGFQNLFFHDAEEAVPLSTLFRNNSSFFIHHSSMPFALWIGPEGGWTKEEISFARENNFHLVRLGPLTLRAETAALCAISSVMMLCDLPVVGAPSPRNGPSAC